MTGQPAANGQQQPSPPENLDTLLVVQAATLLAFEAGSAHAATAGLRRALKAFARSANQRWMLAGGNPAGMAVVESQAREHLQQALILDLRALAASVQRELAPILQQEARAALALGAKHAGEQAGLNVAVEELVLDDTAKRIIDSTPAAAVRHLLRAADQIATAQTGLDLQNAVSEAQRSVKSVNTGSTYLTNHAANDAARQVAEHAGAELLWIAERDACVICLALAGEIANPMTGLGFDEFATYGPYEPPSIWPLGMPLMRPPRHPHCRCQVCVWFGFAPGQPDLPSALKREAARSILKGWSLPSESNRVRIEAARKLLASGGRGLPKTVQERSAHDVARGKFESRTVPKYEPKKKENTHV